MGIRELKKLIDVHSSLINYFYITVYRNRINTLFILCSGALMEEIESLVHRHPDKLSVSTVLLF